MECLLQIKLLLSMLKHDIRYEVIDYDWNIK